VAKIYEALMRASKERKESAKRRPLPLTNEVPLHKACIMAQEEQHSLKQVESEKRPAFPVTEEVVPQAAFFIAEEEMLALIESIESLLSQTRKQIIQFIGSREGEAASTIACEYARASATKIGLSVLLLDLDRLHTSLDLFFSQGPNGRWLETIGNVGGSGALHCRHRDSKLYDITPNSDGAPDNSIFDSDTTRPFWELLRKRFDLLVIDSAPIANPVYALAAVEHVDAIVLVFETEKVEWTVSGSVADIGLSMVMESIERGILSPQNVVKCRGKSLLILTPFQR
jgi:Mrp family chromosome partitioning ATPase